MKLLIQNEKKKERKVFGLDISEISLILVNIFILVELFFFGLNTFSILFIYWFENIIIWLFYIFKQLVPWPRPLVYQALNLLSDLIIFPFIMLIQLALMGSLQLSSFTWNINFIYNLIITSLFNIMVVSSPYFIFTCILLFLSHGISFYKNFLKGGEWIDPNPKEILIGPYRRIFVMQLAIIFGVIFILITGIPKIAISFFILLKIIADLMAHRKERRLAKSKVSYTFKS